MTLRISSAFDGGNIECLACDRADNIRLRILADRRTDFLQWFYFRLTGARGPGLRTADRKCGGRGV